MSEPTSHAPGYVAQLTLTVPGDTEPATVTIILAPTDGVQVNGRIKPLSDCTLAELKAFANTLESEVWETSAAITLLDLHEEKQVEIRLVRLDDEGKPGEEVPDPLEQAIVFPAKSQARKPKAQPAETVAETQAVETENPAPASEPEARPEPPKPQPTKPEPAKPEPAAQQPAPVAPPAAQPKPAPATLHDNVRILEPPKEEEGPAVPPVVPSTARVRVAGHRLRSGTPTWMAVDILMDEPPLRAMQAHALSSLDREVAGVMIGARPEKQPDGRYVVHIIDSIAAKYTVMQGASVTYTADSWRYLNDTLAERYPNDTAVMVGWYHTHPGFGIFLSGMDQFIHQNFFTQVWHIAYVLDPRARTSGFFCWNREKTKVNRHDFGWPDWAADSW